MSTTTATTTTRSTRTTCPFKSNHNNCTIIVVIIIIIDDCYNDNVLLNESDHHRYWSSSTSNITSSNEYNYYLLLLGNAGEKSVNTIGLFHNGLHIACHSSISYWVSNLIGSVLRTNNKVNGLLYVSQIKSFLSSSCPYNKYINWSSLLQHIVLT